MSIKKQVIDNILLAEGAKHTDDPADSGGSTRWGVTLVEARASGYLGPMVTLPRDVAYRIFSTRYWDAVRGDDMVTISSLITAEVVDTGVNCGVVRASMFLQRSLNVLNRAEKLYDDIRADGKVGPATLAALSAYLAVRDETTLLTALNCLQGAFYIELAEKREKDERWVYGWLKNRVFI